MSTVRRVFALTICAYSKPGMDEDEYHEYMSKVHAASVRDLMVKNKIVGYSMQHNTTKAREMLRDIFGGMYQANEAPYDCIIQIAFHSPQDFIAVKEDPHYRQVVLPDHGNFADTERTTMVTGWLEKHIENGRVVM